MLGRPILSRVVGLEQYVEGHRRLMELVRRRHIRLLPNSRVVEYGHVLASGESLGGERALPTDVLRATLELRQLIAIADCLEELPEMERHFETVLQGHYHTLDGPTHDPGRDKQFELFVAAKLARSGLRPELAEPDVVVDLGGRQVGIAAKRPRRMQAIQKALRTGRRQIRDTGHLGFIAVDASMYPLAHGQLIMGLLDSPAHAAGATVLQLNDVIRRSWPLLRRILVDEPACTGTAGLLFHLAVPFSADLEAEIQMVIGEAWALVPAQLEVTNVGRALLSAVGKGRPPFLVPVGGPASTRR